MAKWVFLRLAFVGLIFLGIFIAVSYVFKESGVSKVETLAEKTVTAPEKKSEQKPREDIKFEDVVFPENFFFGTASSDFQTAGLAPASDWANDWDKIADLLEKDSLAKKGIKREAIHSGIANDFYNRYKEDFDIAGENNLTQVHRISLEWSRIEPEEGKWDLDAVKKYREIFSYMKSRGIEPMICLNHFPNPKWFADLGGWENNRAEYYYGRYAEFVAKNIGVPLKIKWWLTYNEPQFSIIVPYGNGTWPPFKGVNNLQDKEGFARMMHVASNILDGHRLAYRSIHKVMDPQLPADNPVMVSFASAPGAFYPYDENSPTDKIAENFFNLIYTLSLDSFVGNIDRDFIGLNYYGRNKLTLHISFWDGVKKAVVPKSWLTEERPFGVQWFTPDQLPNNNRPREFYPQGLYDMIMKFRDYGLPIVITENGIHDSTDNFREEFLVIHLKAIHDAIRAGVDVRGYQYWSLTDTWEPGDASFSNFGFISIDRNNNLERKLVPSALTYGEIVRTKTIRKELLEKHKELLTQN